MAEPVSAAPTRLSPSQESLLGLLTEARVEGWTPRLTARIISEGKEMYRPDAKRFRLSEDELVSHLWEFWKDIVPDSTLFPVTSAYLYRTFQKERSAQFRLTSVEGTRRVGARDFIIVPMPENDADVPLSPGPSVDTMPRSIVSPGLIAVRQVLIGAGLDVEAATGLVEAVVDQLGPDTKGVQGAIKQLGKDGAMAEKLGLSLAQWRAIVGLVLGTTRGQPGLYELISRGHPNPRRLSYIRGQIARLLENGSSD